MASGSKPHGHGSRAQGSSQAYTQHSSSISGGGLTQPAGHGLSNIKEKYEEVDSKVLEGARGARVIASCKVPKEEAQGEDVAASHHRWKEPAKITKKARRQEGTSYYKTVLNTLMEKQEHLPENEKEAFAKEAAATASKLLYRRCWSLAPHIPAMLNAPYLPTISTAVTEESNVKEESNDELNDSMTMKEESNVKEESNDGLNDS